MRNYEHLRPHQFKPGADWRGNRHGRPRREPVSGELEELLEEFQRWLRRRQARCSQRPLSEKKI